VRQVLAQNRNIACALVSLGDIESALDLLEPIIRTSSAEVVRDFKIDSSLDGLRTHARYVSPIAEVDTRLDCA